MFTVDGDGNVQPVIIPLTPPPPRVPLRAPVNQPQQRFPFRPTNGPNQPSSRNPTPPSDPLLKLLDPFNDPDPLAPTHIRPDPTIKLGPGKLTIDFNTVYGPGVLTGKVNRPNPAQILRGEFFQGATLQVIIGGSGSRRDPIRLGGGGFGEFIDKVGSELRKEYEPQIRGTIERHAKEAIYEIEGIYYKEE